MERIITVSPALWLVVPDVAPEYDDGLITLRDNSGGEALIDRDEIAALIVALQALADESEPPW